MLFPRNNGATMILPIPSIPNILSSIPGVVDPSRLGEVGLVLFLVSFVAMFVWAVTRSRQEINHWSDLPLESLEGKGEDAAAPAAAPLRLPGEREEAP